MEIKESGSVSGYGGRIMKILYAAMVLLATGLIGCGDVAGGMAEPEEGADRQYEFLALMTGYYGRGGDIDGKKNPTIHARKGEVVTLVIVNGERMAHDIAMRRHRARSEIIIEKGETTRVTFVADVNDSYYCTIPGHVETGMIGEFVIIE